MINISQWETVTYLLVFIPWSFLYLHDFLSIQWHSISNTRWRGRTHVVGILLPMGFLVNYVYIKRGKDNTEFFTALAALFLSLYHLMRTIIGLQSLRLFEDWAVETAITMESASYECELSEKVWQEYHRVSPKSTAREINEREMDVSSDDTRSSQEEKHFNAFLSKGISFARSCTSTVKKYLPLQNRTLEPSEEEKQKRRIRDEIQKMLVNNTIVDNEMFNSAAARLVTFPDDRQLQDEEGKRYPFYKRVAKYVQWVFMIPTWFIPKSITDRFNLDKREIRADKPFENYIRWTVCYLSQFGKQWVLDHSSENVVNELKNSWSREHVKFASDVWATAVLRMMLAPRYKEIYFDPNNARDIIPYIESVDSEKQMSLLCPSSISRLKIRKPWNVFRKEDLLSRCYENGSGLPLNANLISDRNTLVAKNIPYDSTLREAIFTLEYFLYDEAQNIKQIHLELFALYIWIGKWNSRTAEKELKSLRFDPPQDGKPRYLMPQHPPVQALQDQLGMDRELPLTQCSFPIMRFGYGPYLRDNRSILEVSARIDNWLSILVAAQVNDYATDIITKLKGRNILQTGLYFVRKEQKGEGLHSDARNPLSSFDAHKEFEYELNRMLLTKINTENEHMDQGITFLGCIVEFLRSSFAFTMGKITNAEGNPWEIPVEDTKRKFSIDVSKQLSESIEEMVRNRKADVERGDATLKERLLWECQNGLMNQITTLKTSERDETVLPRKVEAIALMVLGNPGVDISIAGNIDCNNSKVVSFEMKPMAAPQPFYVKGIFHVQEHPIIILCITPACDRSGRQPKHFNWQEWRDAIEGRLCGKERWQMNHFKRAVRAHHTSTDIRRDLQPNPVDNFWGYYTPNEQPNFTEESSEKQGMIWAGWKPFRARFADYENNSLYKKYNSSNTRSKPGSYPTHLRWKGFEDGYYERFEDESVDIDAAVKLSAFFEQQNSISISRKLKDIIEDVEESESGVLSYQSEAPRLAETITKIRDAERMLKEGTHETETSRLEQMKNVTIGTQGVFYEYGKWLLQDDHPIGRKVQHFLRQNWHFGMPEGNLFLERAVQVGSVDALDRLVTMYLEDTSHDEQEFYRLRLLIGTLWRVVARSHKGKVNETERMTLREWADENVESIQTKLDRLIDINIALIKFNPTAEMMVDLGLRLAKWWKEEEHIKKAADLLESAILCGEDRLAMVSLAMLNVQSGNSMHDDRYATLLLKRACFDKKKNSKQDWSLKDGEVIVRSYITDLKDIDQNVAGKFHVALNKYDRERKYLTGLSTG